MIVQAELRVPAAPSRASRERIMAHAPRAGEQSCERCGVDRFHLLDALCDPDCWENRAMAMSLIRGCQTCREQVSAAMAQAGVAPAKSRNGSAGVPVPANRSNTIPS